MLMQQTTNNVIMLRAFSGFWAISRLPMGIFRILKRPSHLEMVGPFQDFGQSRDGPRAFSGFWNGHQLELFLFHPVFQMCINFSWWVLQMLSQRHTFPVSAPWMSAMPWYFLQAHPWITSTDLSLFVLSIKCIFVYQQTTNVWLPMTLKHYQHALFTWTVFINISIDNQSERAYNLEMVAQSCHHETDHGQSRDGPNRENTHNNHTAMTIDCR